MTHGHVMIYTRSCVHQLFVYVCASRIEIACGVTGKLCVFRFISWIVITGFEPNDKKSNELRVCLCTVDRVSDVEEKVTVFLRNSFSFRRLLKIAATPFHFWWYFSFSLLWNGKRNWIYIETKGAEESTGKILEISFRIENGRKSTQIACENSFLILLLFSQVCVPPRPPFASTPWRCRNTLTRTYSLHIKGDRLRQNKKN